MALFKAAFFSTKVFVKNGIFPACIVVESGKITDIITEEEFHTLNEDEFYEIVDVGDLLLMPGVVDCHVHVNEPGRTEWEGYKTATRAAAVGGVTTIIDMPLNSIPSTVTLSAFEQKLESAHDKCYVDVGFWGGIVPGNHHELMPMLDAGVMGFKCFLIHSGVDDFPAVDRSDLETAFQELQGSKCVVLFHAEMECDCPTPTSEGESNEYKTFLATRPEEMERKAIKLVCDMCLKYRVRCHIVHLSAASALPMIVEAKAMGAPLTVETCHHYLTLDAETIPPGATEYKCCPPIREKHNQRLLWDALKAGHIDMVVSDHSPCTPDLKSLQTGDFLEAWGGISSVQFGLSLFWSHAERYNMTIADMVHLMCKNTAKLANVDHRKGNIEVGYDADFVAWDPVGSYKVHEGVIRHKNKVTPYKGKSVKGTVHMTVLGGKIIYEEGELAEEPQGLFLLNEVFSPLEPSTSDDYDGDAIPEPTSKDSHRKASAGSASSGSDDSIRRDSSDSISKDSNDILRRHSVDIDSIRRGSDDTMRRHSVDNTRRASVDCIRRGSVGSGRRGSIDSIQGNPLDSLRRGSVGSIRRGSVDSVRRSSVGSVHGDSSTQLRKDSFDSLRRWSLKRKDSLTKELQQLALNWDSKESNTTLNSSFIDDTEEDSTAPNGSPPSRKRDKVFEQLTKDDQKTVTMVETFVENKFKKLEEVIHPSASELKAIRKKEREMLKIVDTFVENKLHDLEEHEDENESDIEKEKRKLVNIVETYVEDQVTELQTV